MRNCTLGFNGERPDVISAATHLGNGYRAYNPALLRFNCPDGWSPLGSAGINPYAYCAGDPVNQADPSGHFSIGGALGIGVGIIGFLLTPFTGGTSLAAAVSVCSLVAGITSVGMSIASEIVHDQKVASILGWTGMALGLASGVGAGFMSTLAPDARSLSGLLLTKGTRLFQTTNVAITEETEMRSLSSARAAKAKAYIADPLNFEHQVHYQGQRGLVDSRHLKPLPGAVSSFRNRYQPDVWELMANNRDPRVQQYYTSDVIEHQSLLVASSDGYEHQLPSRVILKDVVAEGLRDVNEGTYSPHAFLRNSGIGRSIARFAQTHQMSLTRVDVTRELQYGGHRALDFNLYFASSSVNFRYLPEAD